MIELGFARGKRFAVMGLGKSGLAAARALAAAGAEVLAWDDGAGARAAAEAAGLALTDLHGAELSGVEALVLSPGIPHSFPVPSPVAARCRAAGIPIIGDVELLFRARPAAAYVGITGTNGKSTTTSLIGHILKGAGRPVEVGGNLGTPVLTFAPLGEAGVYVLEMSSYQLELTPSIRFNVAVLLNVTPDHLDRHGGMDGYVAAKRRIFQHPARSHTAVVAVDDDHTRAIFDELEAEGRVAVIPVSAEREVPGVWVRDGLLFDGGAEPVLDLRGIPTLPGRHNWQNAAAAFTACRAAGVEVDAIVAGIRSFPGLAHRQQFLGEADGVRWVNDSKATNADAAEKALVCYDDIYWILGGQAKDGGLAGLEPHMGRIRHAFLIGDATEAFAAWLADRNVPFTRCGVLDRAVAEAASMARAERLPGATVLLSPACASFDQFRSFEHRGEIFAALARAEIEKGGTPP
ncbi:UDP-N-acetylmuramoyl-L-alanine--D-glutamate ligase [Arenibaculum pallidiluteum]|uniref:UDP-N-acetylmuramoyl-L-alanine--D-glutamate ligase n=1 Tax=Arenibaculum pallidiluteum TaxID=2812559 RepID=UPI001A96B7EF|nr:UDP-N-acetylmuramoyl-L-alanine--D-glutamate ligase [Arenibaculum pallidiluteum]